VVLLSISNLFIVIGLDSLVSLTYRALPPLERLVLDSLVDHYGRDPLRFYGNPKRVMSADSPLSLREKGCSLLPAGWGLIDQISDRVAIVEYSAQITLSPQGQQTRCHNHQ
jgi:hypothetical protein